MNWTRPKRTPHAAATALQRSVLPTPARVDEQHVAPRRHRREHALDHGALADEDALDRRHHREVLAADALHAQAEGVARGRRGDERLRRGVSVGVFEHGPLLRERDDVVARKRADEPARHGGDRAVGRRGRERGSLPAPERGVRLRDAVAHRVVRGELEEQVGSAPRGRRAGSRAPAPRASPESRRARRAAGGRGARAPRSRAPRSSSRGAPLASRTVATTRLASRTSNDAGGAGSSATTGAIAGWAMGCRTGR